jgi:hypothetical protein
VNRDRAALVAWSLWVVATACLAGALALAFLNRSADLEEAGELVFIVLIPATVLAFPTVGALVAARFPANPIGWLFCGVGVVLGFDSLANEWAVYGLFSNPDSVPAVEIMAWLASWLFLPPLFAVAPLLFLMFPDGKFLTRRWRPIGALIVVGAVLVPLQSALAPGRLVEPPFERVVNPVGVEGAAEALEVASLVGWCALAVSTLASAASMLIRLRRAAGIERQQLKWITTAAAAFAFSFVFAGITFSFGFDLIGQITIFLAFVAIPTAAGYAILRHRLYEIDRIINRALVYAPLTALLAASYAAIVLLLQLASEPLTQGSDLAIAGSTLAVAALFRPARRRIQGTVDRRFYRRRYDAQRTLEAFAARLREEVDLDSLSADLRSVVRDTLQPAQVSLWLRGSER